MTQLGKRRATLMSVGDRSPMAVLLVEQDGDRRTEISIPISQEKADELRPRIFNMLEVELSARWVEKESTDCAQCENPFIRPSHEGSARCRNRKSIASGGTVAHCTCNACF